MESLTAEHLKKMVEQIRRRAPLDRVGIRASDVVAMHPSMVRHFETACPEDENPIGFSKSVGYLHKFSGIPVFQIEEIEPGIFEFGTYEAFCVKYPEWYKRQLEAKQALEMDEKRLMEQIKVEDDHQESDGE